MSVKNSYTTADYIEWNTAVNLVNRLFKDKEYRISLLIGCGIFFGLRISDLLQLTWDMVLNTTSFVITEKKTKKRREVKINTQFQKHIQDCFQALNITNEEEKLFLSARGRVYSIQRINVILKEIKQKYGLKTVKNISSHSLRKTFGRHIYEKADTNGEIALALLSELFNHSNISITKRYLGIRQEEILECYELLDFKKKTYLCTKTKLNMNTSHYIYFNPAQSMQHLHECSVDLIVTSPPYPMIEMWDNIMGKQNPAIHSALNSNKPRLAFELMHQELDKIWNECWRVLKEGGFMCINIGDATRSVNGEFALYNNNTRIISSCEKLGFVNLPNILWKKTTNTPNKFMGSGMLPCGAYVTLEHEWILIFRKGGKRNYKSAIEKENRRDSSFFWEERNIWFSDIWEVNGVKQNIDNSTSRKRNASYPLEIPYRLINMYSQKNDIVLDPFIGLGTTTIASILSERNSIGFEIDVLLKPLIKDILCKINITKANTFIENRFNKHLLFVEERLKQGKDIKYYNKHLNCKVMTKQETDLTFRYIKNIILHEDYNELIFKSNYFHDTPLNQFPLLNQ